MATKCHSSTPPAIRHFELITPTLLSNGRSKPGAEMGENQKSKKALDVDPALPLPQVVAAMPSHFNTQYCLFIYLCQAATHIMPRAIYSANGALSRSMQWHKFQVLLRLV